MVPTRTCLACRQRAAKPTLIRLAAVDGAVQVDPPARAQARGAYVCATAECAETALRRDGAPLLRALRAGQGSVDAVALRAALDAERTRRRSEDKVAAPPPRGACT